MNEKEIVQEAIVIGELKKPMLESEFKAEIKGKQEIEDNINSIKEYALNLSKYYQGVVFSEEQIKDAEEEKANINKQKKLVSDFRKEIVKQWNEPIKLFEETAKETEKLLGSTYDVINEQVKIFNNKVLEEIKEKVESYFNEYALSKNIDFISFDNLNVSITKGLLTSTGSLTKKTQDLIVNYIDDVEKNLKMISTLEFKEEILVEYKRTLQIASSIANVQERHQLLEEEKKRQEQLQNIQEKVEEVEKKVEEALEIPKVEEKILSMTFKVYGTIEQLRDIKNYIESKGVKYE